MTDFQLKRLAEIIQSNLGYVPNTYNLLKFAEEIEELLKLDYTIIASSGTGEEDENL